MVAIHITLRKIEDGRHPCALCLALLLFVLIGISIGLALPASQAQAQTYTSPHGGFSDYTQFCELCHDMHDAPGSRLERYMPESAVCFTCHNGTGSRFIIDQQLDMNPATNSMHPIVVNLSQNMGTYSYVPNTTAGIAPPGPYECSTCHDPHGDSANQKLLWLPFDNGENVIYSTLPDPYSACWFCHSAASIINDTTLFSRHNSHIIGQNSSCSACHSSPHGVANTELVGFNKTYVSSSVAGGLGPIYTDLGDHRGSCTLTCHGVDHNSATY
jgi:predicted CXXCH cytochrome family protein